MSSEVETSLTFSSLSGYETIIRDPSTPLGTTKKAAFTITELLVVIALIVILVGLILSTVGYVQKKGARARAEAEIAAMSAALENYKSDNGVYPRDPTPDAATDSLDARTMTDAASTNAAAYQLTSLLLYRALSGDRDLNRVVDAIDEGKNIDGSPLTRPLSQLPKTYFGPKPNQLSPADQTQRVQYLRDPFGNSYGYSTAYQRDVDKGVNPTHGHNPTYDLWSTSGSTDPNQWVKNW